MRDEHGYQIHSVRQLPPGPPITGPLVPEPGSKIDAFIGRTAAIAIVIILGEALWRWLA
jgi:hypothetical protein